MQVIVLYKLLPQMIHIQIQLREFQIILPEKILNSLSLQCH